MGAASWASAGDPLRLELPPADVGDDHLDPAAAAVLGALYLASELEQAGAVPVAEALAAQRFTLDIRDRGTAAALELFAERPGRRWLSAGDRERLFRHLFGAPADAANPGNDTFEELLAGYCSALVAVSGLAGPGGGLRPANVLRLASDRLRANLAPRQYGNTALVAGPVVDQLRAALDLLARPGIGALVGAQGVWVVVRHAFGPDAPDIGRHLERGRSGQTLVGSVGHREVPNSADTDVTHAAERWLVATGFELRSGQG
jgi:hypothetical protein